jgi:hypothetical protein
MSEDPKGFDAGDYNLFRYVHNDPLDRTDPMGLADEAVNAKMVQTGVVVNLTMHAQTVLPIGSNIPVRAVLLPNAQLVDYRAAGGLTMGQSFQAMRSLHMGFAGLAGMIHAAQMEASQDQRIYATAYGTRDNDPPGSLEIATPGRRGDRQATLGSGSYANPTTLAVSQRWLRRGDAARYFREGDLVHLSGGRGWFRVEDVCGACGNSRRIDQWTGNTTPEQQSAVTRTYRFHVFHPNE